MRSHPGAETEYAHLLTVCPCRVHAKVTRRRSWCDAYGVTHMPLRSLDAALPCILSCVLHDPLALQCLATRACDAAQPTRLRQHGERTHRALVSRCRSQSSAWLRPHPPSPPARNCVGPALIGIPRSVHGTPPQPRLSPPSERVAMTGAFPAHIGTGTGLFSSRICAGTGWAHPRPTSTLGWDSFSPAAAPGLDSSLPTSAPGLNRRVARWTDPLPHLRQDWAPPPRC